mgnify:CR=1 FL=1
MMKFLIKYAMVPVTAASLFLPLAASAAIDLNTNLTSVGANAYNTSGEPTDLLQIIGTIINVVLGLLGVIFLLFTVYAGFLWMTAAGNEEAVTKAREILKTTIIGLIITLAAYSIASFVVTQLSNATA